MAVALHHSRAVGTDKVVLLGIANHEGDGGAWPSIATLAHYANVSQRTTQRSINALVAMGEISIDPRQGGTRHADPRYRTNLYHVMLRCPRDCDGSTMHRVVDPGVKPTSPLNDPGVTPVTFRGDAGDHPGVTPASPESSLETSLEPAPAVLADAPTVNQVAKQLMDGYWAYVKAETGKHPVGITANAMLALLRPFIRAGYTPAELKRAMKAVRDNSRSFTAQVLEQHLDGRARQRVATAASAAQAAANVTARQRNEAEQAVADGDDELAWRIVVDKARAKQSTQMFAAIADDLRDGMSDEVIRGLRNIGQEAIDAVRTDRERLRAAARAVSPPVPHSGQTKELGGR